MRHEQQPYYVGLLKAAVLHGATHKAVMEFQIVTPKRMTKIKAGRNLIVLLPQRHRSRGVGHRGPENGHR